MAAEIAIGISLLFATTVVHATAMTLLILQLRAWNAVAWAARSHLTRTGLVSFTVIALFFASLIEAGIWGVTYLMVGAIAELEEALYFSMVTYTTLGYGDVVLPPEGWRLLASFQAANGIVMFGWTTALIFFMVQRLYLTQSHE